jgi:hypothetical protein
VSGYRYVQNGAEETGAEVTGGDLIFFLLGGLSIFASPQTSSEWLLLRFLLRLLRSGTSCGSFSDFFGVAPLAVPGRLFEFFAQPASTVYMEKVI